MDDPFEKVIFVLTANSFQKWLLSQGDPDQMFYNCDLESIGKQAFADHLWQKENPDPSWIKVWLLDMQMVNGGMYLVDFDFTNFPFFSFCIVFLLSNSRFGCCSDGWIQSSYFSTIALCHWSFEHNV